MTSHQVIKEIYLLLGGQLYFSDRGNLKHKNLLTWQVTTYIAVDKVLSYVHPYLIVKKSQADVLREFLNTKENSCYKIGKGNGVMGNGTFLKPEIFILLPSSKVSAALKFSSIITLPTIKRK